MHEQGAKEMLILTIWTVENIRLTYKCLYIQNGNAGFCIRNRNLDFVLGVAYNESEKFQSSMFPRQDHTSRSRHTKSNK